MNTVRTYETIDKVPPLKEINILTGFRPSTSANQAGGSDFTLGHMVQIEQVLNIHDHAKKAGIPIESAIIIADMQGFSDNPTQEHLKNIQRFTRLYCCNALACFSGSENITLFRESKVYREIIQPLSHFIGSNIGYDAVDEDLVKSRVEAIKTRHGKTITDARLRGDFVDQAAHAMSANANIIPAGANQLSAFALYNQAVENYHKNGFNYPYEKEIYGLIANGYLIGPDGKKMSTSKGNAIEISTPLDELDVITNNADDSFLVSIATHFGNMKEFQTLNGRGSRVAYVQSLLRKKLEPIQDKYSDLQNDKNLIEETMTRHEGNYKERAQKIVDAVDVFATI